MVLIAEQGDLIMKIELDNHLKLNPKMALEYYDEVSFPYKEYLKRRYFPLKIRMNIWLKTLFNYKLRHRLRFQYQAKRRFIGSIIKLMLHIMVKNVK